MKLDTKYLSLDLEMNQPSGKIIQVGIAIGCLHDYMNNTIDTHKWYIDPEEDITDFITGLTGITNLDIKNYSLPHEEVAKRLSALIEEHKCFINPVTWGIGDAETLKKEFYDRGIEFKNFGRRSIDIKTWYVMKCISMGRNPSGGLSSSMASLSNNKLKFTGVQHRADIDAWNTLKLFFYLIEKENKTQSLIKEIGQL